MSSMLNSTPRSSKGQRLKGNHRLPRSNEGTVAHGDRDCGRARSTLEPYCHAGLEVGRIALRIEAQPQRVAIMITDRALGLPGCKWAQRQELGDEGRARFARAHPSHVEDHSN